MANAIASFTTTDTLCAFGDGVLREPETLSRRQKVRPYSVEVHGGQYMRLCMAVSH